MPQKPFNPAVSFYHNHRNKICSLIKCKRPVLHFKTFCSEHERKFRFKCCLNIEGKIFCDRHYEKYLIYEKENETTDEGLEH